MLDLGKIPGRGAPKVPGINGALGTRSGPILGLIGLPTENGPFIGIAALEGVTLCDIGSFDGGCVFLRLLTLVARGLTPENVPLLPSPPLFLILRVLAPISIFIHHNLEWRRV